MTADERRLFTNLLGALAERFSGAGHIMQQVDWEHRGNCPPGDCCLRCTTYTTLLVEASEMLEAELDAVAVEAPTQGSLFDAGEVVG